MRGARVHEFWIGGATALAAFVLAFALVPAGAAWAEPVGEGGGEDAELGDAGGVPGVPDVLDVTDPDAGESAGVGEPDTNSDANPNDAGLPLTPQGLVHRDGKTYFYNDDGTLFTGGYKPVDLDGKRLYYYFTEDGSAYTDGYLEFEVNGKTYYFYFTEDGTAFTGGYKELVIDNELCYFYFLPNGQAFNTGYKTAMIDGKKYYFYFGENARAVLGQLQPIDLGDRTAYMLFGDTGRAFTDGYKELVSGGVGGEEIENGEGSEAETDYYYFLANGQAFTTGYKVVKIDGENYYFFFEDDGTAFTDGLKAVPFGEQSYYYLFAEDGKAYTSSWQTVDEATYYVQANGRVAHDGFCIIDGVRYYFGADFATPKDTWFCVGDGYYYAQEDGALLTDAVKEGYRLGASGKSVTKFRVVQYVNEYTDPSMTDREKIDALYDWLLTNSMTWVRNYEYLAAGWTWKDGWVDDYAARHMNQWGGNCFCYASFFGLMVREATGLPVQVCVGKSMTDSEALVVHGWTIVCEDGKWYTYDVMDEKHGTYRHDQCYRVPYSMEEHTSGSVQYDGVETPLY